MGIVGHTYPKSMVSVTKLGDRQRSIRWLIGRYGALTWTELMAKTGLKQKHLSSSLKALVAAEALVHCWDKEGRAVYRLPERKADVS